MRKLALVLFILLLPIAQGQTRPSSIGTWRLNLAKSDFKNVPKPKSALLVITDDRDSSLKFSYTEVAQDGKIFTLQFTGAYDGKPYPVTGNDPTGAGGWKLRAAAFKRHGNTETATWTMTDGSTSTETSTRSGDTITDIVNERDGSTITVVYDRVPDRRHRTPPVTR